MLQSSRVMTSAGADGDSEVLTAAFRRQPCCIMARLCFPLRGPYRAIIVNATLIFRAELRHPMKSN